MATADEETFRPFLARITVHQGAGAGCVFDGVDLPAVVGRGQDANVQLPDPDKLVSRRHVLLGVQGGTLTVQDLSSNGTRVGNTLVVAGEAIAVENDTPIWLGHETMITVLLLSTRDVLRARLAPVKSHAANAETQRPSGRLAVWTLGATQVSANGHAIADSAWQSRKALELLVYLAQDPRPHDPDRLSAAVWPEMESISKTTLQSTLSRIRRACREASSDLPDPIEQKRGLYAIHPALQVELDSLRFEAYCQQAVQAADASARSQLLASALDLYQGEFLPGHTSEWVELLRTRLQGLYRSAQEGLARAYEELGKTAEAIVEYERLVQEDPGREAAHAGLIRCYAGLGKRDEAVRQCMECARILRKTLHISPGPEINALYRTLTEQSALG
ncbi:MAG TPA: BTAD domain-containing putative transcriptional regulator [Candidatus Xenobia bacterium]|jgi:DNA-binding SARP family transcriptional activator